MRRRPEPHVNHERWIISYADFVTLMFALFVAMYAMSLKDKHSGQKVSESVREAVTKGGLASTVESFFKTPETKDAQAHPPAKTPAIDPSLRQPFEQLQKGLKKQIESGSVRLHLEARGLVITLQEHAFFASGDDVIYQTAYPTIEQVAKTVANLSNPVRLEGHTDAIPINTPRFRNNWELSTARSIALLELFESKYGLNASKFAVAGYGQNQPVADNGTEGGRAQNRRVEIVILGWQDTPKDGQASRS